MEQLYQKAVWQNLRKFKMCLTFVLLILFISLDPIEISFKLCKRIVMSAIF